MNGGLRVGVSRGGYSLPVLVLSVLVPVLVGLVLGASVPGVPVPMVPVLILMVPVPIDESRELATDGLHPVS